MKGLVAKQAKNLFGKRSKTVTEFKEITVNPDEAELLVLFNSDAVIAAKECETQNFRENYVIERLKKMDKMLFLFAGWRQKILKEESQLHWHA